MRRHAHYAVPAVGEVQELRISKIALGSPYHAALVELRPRQPSGPILHRHLDFGEMLYVLSGQGSHRMAGGPVGLRPGNLVLIRPADEHTFLGLPPTGLVFINIAFALVPWHSFLRLTGYQRFWEDYQRELWPRRIALDGPESERVRGAFQHALDRFNTDPTLIDVVELWCQVMPLLAAKVSPETPGVAACPVWLSEACSAMQREENLRGGLPRFRQLAAVSPSHLTRMMHQHYGVNPVEWVTGLRLEHAAVLLATTRTPVTELALRCGFSSPSYFSHCFQRAYGCSPRAYRNRGRQAVVPGGR